MEITYDGTNWSINNDSLEPDFATHATISATAVANSIAIGYYDFGAWVNGWSFPNTYTSGDVPASEISGNWASSFVSMIEQGSSSTPTYRTGTSQAFSLNVGSGSWANEGYTLFVDDTPTTASSGVVVNGVRQYEWDLKNSSNNLFSGADHYFYFIPGNSATSGLWYLGGSLASRSGSVIADINGGGSFNETNAFVDGLVPYGDIP